MWQKCPICNGEGKVQNYGTVSSLFSMCPTCNGARIISEINGLPPNHTPSSDSYNGTTEKSDYNGTFIMSEPYTISSHLFEANGTGNICKKCGYEDWRHSLHKS